MDLGLSGRVALVTGVSYGIGASTAAALIEEGMKVFGTSRTAPEPRAGLAHATLDMSAADAGQKAVEGCLAEFGRLDVLVNNVGFVRLAAGFEDESEALWQQNWELNFMSAVRTAGAALPALLDGQGVVVNVSSFNAMMPVPQGYAYSVCKAALNNFSVNLAHEYANRGLRVVAVCPGPVDTPMWLGPSGIAAQLSALGAGEADEIIAGSRQGAPIGRFSSPEEVAALIAFLASPRAASITGTTITIDGGITPTT
jgi:NAD(P)-dependent dehydrogenase (short-subunit alcohol dehydrogenase family)